MQSLFKKGKRFLTGILALCMLASILTSITFTVGAAPEDEVTQPETSVESSEAVAATEESTPADASATDTEAEASQEEGTAENTEESVPEEGTQEGEEEVQPIEFDDLYTEVIAENSQYIMYFCDSLADIGIRDKQTGRTWTGVPLEWESDTLAKGVNKFMIASHIVINVYKRQITKEGEISISNMTETIESSYLNCTRDGNFTTEKIDNGIRVTYNFSALNSSSFEVPKGEELKVVVEYTLTDTGFNVTIPSGGIQDNDEVLINYVYVLPYFNAGQKTDDGYLFVPDGSGALINFDTNYTGIELARTVYGQDLSMNDPGSMPVENGYRMPVFGNKKNDTGFLGIATSGEFAMNIRSGVAGNMNNFFRVYPAFIYRAVGSLSVYDSATTNNANYRTLSPTPITKDITVEYHLLQDDKANYVGMAEEYQEYLLEQGVLKDKVTDSVDMHLDVLGGLRIESSFIGIPLTRFTALTSFEGTQDMLDHLAENGIDNVNLKYYGFNSGGYMSTWTTEVKPAAKLGGEEGLLALQDYTLENGDNLFLAGELVEVHQTGDGFSSSEHAVRNVSNGISFSYKYYRQDNTSRKADKSSHTWYKTTYLSLPEAVQKYVNSTAEIGLKNIGLESIGELVYSEYAEKKITYRDQIADYLYESLDILASQAEKVMLTYGNAYTWGYATDLTDVPLENSGFYMESESVPFYQMVIHGYITYSGPAYNLSSDKTKSFLQSIEYGAIPHYIGMQEESSILLGTELNTLFSCNYEEWLPNAIKYQELAGEYYDLVYNQRMVNHEKLADQVYRTTYENGVSVIVNYNETEAYSADGVRVDALSFALVK